MPNNKKGKGKMGVEEKWKMKEWKNEKTIEKTKMGKETTRKKNTFKENPLSCFDWSCREVQKLCVRFGPHFQKPHCFVEEEEEEDDEEDSLALVWVPVLLLFMTSLAILSSFCSRLVSKLPCFWQSLI